MVYDGELPYASVGDWEGWSMLGNGSRYDGISFVWTLKQLRQWARTVKQDILILALAAHDPRVPWYAKAVAACVAAYAFSPIDFIPDFIPILGYLDDVIIVPLGILLAIRLIPPSLLAEHRQTVIERSQQHPTSYIGAVIIVLLWYVVGVGLWCIK